MVAQQIRLSGGGFGVDVFQDLKREWEGVVLELGFGEREGREGKRAMLRGARHRVRLMGSVRWMSSKEVGTVEEGVGMGTGKRILRKERTDELRPPEYSENLEEGELLPNIISIIKSFTTNDHFPELKEQINKCEGRRQVSFSNPLLESIYVFFALGRRTKRRYGAPRKGPPSGAKPL